MHFDGHDVEFNPPGEPHGDGSSDALRLITIIDVARLLRVSPRTVHRWVRSGEFIRPLRLGGTIRWRLSDVQKWLRSR